MTNTSASGLPQLSIPGHTWRWFNPQGGLPVSDRCIQLVADGATLGAVATIDRNADGTWHAEGRVNGMAAIIAGNWVSSLTVEECAAAIAAHLAPVPVVKPGPAYRLTIIPPVWNGKRGGWTAGTPVVTEYATIRELHAALKAHGVPEWAYRDGDSYRDAAWGLATPVRLPKHVLKLALEIYRRMTESYAEYERECEQDRRNGHAAHYCEHGTNQWTDYDNICGPCEDGYTLATVAARRRAALDAAKERHAEAKAMLSWAGEANRHGMASNEFVAATMARYETLMEV